MAVLNQNLNGAFVLFELMPANEISFLGSYKKTLSKCCIDPLRPPDFTGLGLTAPPLVEGLSAGSALHCDPNGWSESLCDSLHEKSQKMKESPESLLS